MNLALVITLNMWKTKVKTHYARSNTETLQQVR